MLNCRSVARRGRGVVPPETRSAREEWLKKEKKRFEAIQKVRRVLGRKNQPLKLKIVKQGEGGTGIVHINELKSLRSALATHDR